jgi:uncharacterized Ntn-hydrolase superfamily protein
MDVSKRLFVLLTVILLPVFFCGCKCRQCASDNCAESTVVAKTVDNPLLPDYQVTHTFSIVAVDPNTGICGAAVASRYPGVGRIVPFVRAGVGAFCTQHWNNPTFDKRAFDMLEAGKLPEEVLGELLKDDDRSGKRQLAIIDMKGRAANRNPFDPDKGGVWWGCMSGKYYACQGNMLVGPEVVVAMAKAYETTKGSMADRLVAAIAAGDCVGGDYRGRLGAGIRVAKKGVEGIWFELYVDEHSNAVYELLKKYAETEHEAKGEWPGGKMPFQDPCPDRKEPVRPPQ